jgi:hypothetical protein
MHNLSARHHPLDSIQVNPWHAGLPSHDLTLAVAAFLHLAGLLPPSPLSSLIPVGRCRAAPGDPLACLVDLSSNRLPYRHRHRGVDGQSSRAWQRQRFSSASHRRVEAASTTTGCTRCSRRQRPDCSTTAVVGSEAAAWCGQIQSKPRWA